MNTIDDNFLANLTTLPGVYQMRNKGGKVLYVGKAKNLKKRVNSYFKGPQDTKTIRLVNQITSIDITVTRNEREALLLENNLIKELKPRYNVIFKDDKSYPYLFISKDKDDDFPRLTFYRGNKSAKGSYYGPYPSAKTARDALTLLQTLFRLRQCDNSFFKNRTRPCLQYQIHRCTAPCVQAISKEAYLKDVKDAKLFLEGQNNEVIERLVERMEAASEKQDYELALRFRDEIRLLRQVQDQQIILKGKSNIDVLAVVLAPPHACIQMLIIRNGRMLGSKSYFIDTENVYQNNLNTHFLETFITQHYLKKVHDHEIPNEIIVSHVLDNKKDLEILIQETTDVSVKIRDEVRTDRKQWLLMAEKSAEEALKARRGQPQNLQHRFADLQQILELDAVPQRIECIDISHLFGEATVGSCVVFGLEGPLKSEYRKYNIQTHKASDDYAALAELVTRRFTKLKEIGEVMPDVLIVDGGKGQLNRVEQALEECQVVGICLIGVAKGKARKPGEEKLFITTSEYENKTTKGKNHPLERLELDPHSPAFHLIQQCRDEAHRFAISAHRRKRDKKRVQSVLETIPGIGKIRRNMLLKQFGGLQELEKVSLEALTKVPGMSQILAERVYQVLHGEGGVTWEKK